MAAWSDQPGPYRYDGGPGVLHKDDYRCLDCGYGVAGAPPAACPMCACAGWARTGHGSTGRLELRRIGAAAVLLTPPPLDPAGSAGLVQTVADLAHTCPDIVLDLRDAAPLGGSGGRLLLRLAALVAGAGGRLLLAVPGRAGGEAELREVAGTEGA